MEQMLPERCGGLPGQYQMSIENRSGGLSFIRVRISPQAGDVDTGRVRAILWRELTRVAPLTARYWRAADTVTVVREEPRALPSGKVPAVYRGGPESQQQNTEGSSPAAGGERGNPH